MSRKKRRTPAQRAGTPSRRVTVAPDAYTQHAVVDDPLRPYLPDFRIGLDDEDDYSHLDFEFGDGAPILDEAAQPEDYIGSISQCSEMVLSAMYVHAVVTDRAASDSLPETELRTSVERFGMLFLEAHYGSDDIEAKEMLSAAMQTCSAAVVALLSYARTNTVAAQWCIGNAVDDAVKFIAHNIVDAQTRQPFDGRVDIAATDAFDQDGEDDTPTNEDRLRAVVDAFDGYDHWTDIPVDEAAVISENAYRLLFDAAFVLTGIFAGAREGDLIVDP